MADLQPTLMNSLVVACCPVRNSCRICFKHYAEMTTASRPRILTGRIATAGRRTLGTLTELTRYCGTELSAIVIVRLTTYRH